MVGLVIGRQRRAWWLLTPFLVGALVLFVIPALLTFGLAFTEYDAISAPKWNGLENFKQVYNDELFPIALKNTLYFTAIAIPLRLLGALALALLLSQKRKGFGLYRAAAYLPTVIPDVAYALIWLWIFNPLYGPLNVILEGLRFDRAAWLVEPSSAKNALILMSLFQVGEGFVVMLAGRRDIPSEYYDSVKVFGGDAWQGFMRVTLPLLAPWMLLLIARDVVMSFQYSFTYTYLMTGGDPYYSTLFMPLLAYEEAFDRFRFGPGSAIMLFIFVSSCSVVWVLYRGFRRLGYIDTK